MNRYYMSTWGRFTTADPYQASGNSAAVRATTAPSCSAESLR